MRGPAARQPCAVALPSSLLRPIDAKVSTRRTARFLWPTGHKRFHIVLAAAEQPPSDNCYACDGLDHQLAASVMALLSHVQ